MPFVGRGVGDEIAGNRDLVCDRDDEKARTALWNKAIRVDYEGAKIVLGARQSPANRGEVPSSSRSQGPVDVLQDDESGRTLLLFQGFHQRPKWPERTRPRRLGRRRAPQAGDRKSTR